MICPYCYMQILCTSVQCFLTSVNYTEPRAAVVIYTSYKLGGILPSAFADKQEIQSRGFCFLSPEFDSSWQIQPRFFFATFTINLRMRTSNPGHKVNCIRCYHQSLSVGNVSYKLRERPSSCSRPGCAVSQSHLQKVLCDRPWKTSGLGDILSLFSLLYHKCRLSWIYVWSP